MDRTFQDSDGAIFDSILEPVTSEIAIEIMALTSSLDEDSYRRYKSLNVQKKMCAQVARTCLIHVPILARKTILFIYSATLLI